jgi:hypothetical protein
MSPHPCPCRRWPDHCLYHHGPDPGSWCPGCVGSWFRWLDVAPDHLFGAELFPRYCELVRAQIPPHEPDEPAPSLLEEHAQQAAWDSQFDGWFLPARVPDDPAWSYTQVSRPSTN